MRVFLVLLFSFLCLQASWSQESKGIFRAENEEAKTLKEGDTFIAEFVVWPILHIEEGFLKKTYLNKTFLDYFHVTEVIEEKFSENNSEAYSAKLRVILKKHFESKDFVIWSFRGLNIPVTIKNILSVPLKGRNQKFVFISQKYNREGRSYWLLWLLIAGIFAAGGGYVFINKMREKKKREEEKKRKEKWAKVFSSANSREDYELIYSERTVWKRYLPVETPDMQEFFSTINEHQFKQSWSEDDKKDVKASFDQIRELFNNNYGV